VEKTLTWAEGIQRENITVAKCQKAYKDASSEKSGYIYVMRSAAHDKDIFKIGMTTRATELRSDELARTSGVPDKFLVVQEWAVKDCTITEKMVHDALAKYRINPNREFFKAPYKEIHRVIEDVLNILDAETK